MAACDYDGDGDIDLFIPGGGGFGSNREIYGRAPGCFRNDGNWRFTSIVEKAGLVAPPYYSHGATAGDYDNDGFPDIIITGYRGLALFRNHGDGTFDFEDVRRLGLNDQMWSTSAAWGDIDGDGNLDLYVVHYVDWSFDNNAKCNDANSDKKDLCTPERFEAQPHALYASHGDGTFHDASQSAGLRTDGKGLAVVIADMDIDGLVDIYIGNDTTPNFLYRNLGGLRLEEVGPVSGTSLNDQGFPNDSMGVDVLDYNLDGLPDLWVATFEDEDFALYRNLGNCLFRHVSRITGISASGGLYVGWGTAAADFDRDGDEDLFVSNGHVYRFPKRAPVKQLPLLFENLGTGRFVNVAKSAGETLAIEHLGRGLAAADIDDDGDGDIVLTPINEPVQLLSNESTGSGHWFGLKLIGTVSNRDAIGTLVRIETAAGNQMRQVKGGGSYASTNDLRVFFGIGSAISVTRLEIRWPSGIVQTFDKLRSDSLLTYVEPHGVAQTPPPESDVLR